MKKIIIPVLAMAMQSSCGGGYTRYAILCCTTSFQGGDDEEGLTEEAWMYTKTTGQAPGKLATA